MKFLKAFKVVRDKRWKKTTKDLVPSPTAALTSTSTVGSSLVAVKQSPAQKYICRQNLDEDEQRYFQEMEDAFNHPDVLDVKRMVFGVPILIEEGYLHPHESNLPSLPNAPHAISLTTTIVNPSITTLVNTPPVFQLNDFLIVGELGKGASGSVYKIQDKLTSAFLALKVIHKKGLTTLEIEDAVDEQVALQKMAGEFGFLQLEASFHDSENFYLATAYHPTGDLESIVQKYGPLSSALVKFYAADLILSLEVLHSKGIIHRDIKLANILIDTTGRPVIADLGLAKVFNVDSTKTKVDIVTPYWLLPEGSQFVTTASCGSPAYCAPERMCGCQYSFGADTWSLGVCVYEMLTKRIPWDDDNLQVMAESVVADDLEFKNDDDVDEVTQQFLQQILAKDPRERLTGPDLKAHPYFRDIDWVGMMHRTIAPPSIPTINVPSLCKIQGMEEIKSGDPYDALNNPDPFPTYAFNSPNLRHGALPKDGGNDNNETNGSPPRISGFAFKDIRRHLRNAFRPHPLRESQSASIQNQFSNSLSGSYGAVDPHASGGSQSTVCGFESSSRCRKFGSPNGHSYGRSSRHPIKGKSLRNSADSNTPHPISSTTTTVNPSITTLVNAPPVFQLKNFLIVGELGNGASGSVYKIQDKLTSAFLALKVIHKKSLTIVQIQDVVREQVALQKMAGEFGFLQLEASFHDSENFYLATAYHPAGDLESILEKYGPLSSALVKFYAADLILSLEVLHSKGIIHRDIKPANILIDTTGRLVIADLGLAKVFDVDSTKTTIDIITPYWLLPEGSQFITTASCGSPAYCAPERMCGCQYSFGADIWSLGVCVYEMLTERIPWYDDDLQVMAQSIVTNDLEFEDDDDADEVTQQFLQQILAKDPRERLTGPDLKAHPYFRDIDWEGMMHRTITPPSIPTINVPSPCKIQGMEEIKSGDPYEALYNPDPFPTYAFNSPNLGHGALPKDSGNDNNKTKGSPPRISGFAFKDIRRHLRKTFRPHALARKKQASIQNQFTNHRSGSSGAVEPHASGGSQSTLDGFESSRECRKFGSPNGCSYGTSSTGHSIRGQWLPNSACPSERTWLHAADFYNPSMDSVLPLPFPLPNKSIVRPHPVPSIGKHQPDCVSVNQLSRTKKIKSRDSYDALNNPDPFPTYTFNTLNLKRSALPKDGENDNKTKASPPIISGFAFKHIRRHLRKTFRPHALGQSASIQNQFTDSRSDSSGAVEPHASGSSQNTVDGFEPSSGSPDEHSYGTTSSGHSNEGQSLHNSACSSGRTWLHTADLYNPSVDSVLPLPFPLPDKTNIHPHPIPSIGKLQPDCVSVNLLSRTKTRWFRRCVWNKIPTR